MRRLENADRERLDRSLGALTAIRRGRFAWPGLKVVPIADVRELAAQSLDLALRVVELEQQVAEMGGNAALFENADDMIAQAQMSLLAWQTNTGDDNG